MNPYKSPQQIDAAGSVDQGERGDVLDGVAIFFFVSFIAFVVLAVVAAIRSVMRGENELASFQAFLALLFLIPVLGYRRL